ncbi:MAG: methyltransferase domain-containing protein [Acidobacteriota bacterium]|nr:methyltransferase domain-containing protein [Acidobacteriota bacterium]
MAMCLFLTTELKASRVVDCDGLENTTERHRLVIPRAPMPPCADPLAELDRLPSLAGVIIEMERGWPGQSHLTLAAKVLSRGRRAWFYWPNEAACECLDRDRLRSYWNLWLFVTILRAGRALWRRITAPYRLYLVVRRMYRAASDAAFEYPPGYEDAVAAPVASPLPVELPPAEVYFAERSRLALDQLLEAIAPVTMDVGLPDAAHRIAGVGVYLRTDYWAKISSGGSYGHTCYVAKELAAVTERFVCFMGSRFAMLDDYGLRQVVLPPASETSNETDLLRAHWVYYPQLKLAMEALRPAYIYERLCMGNFCGAALSLELGIPYIVEYNGSEISMTRSFGGVGLTHEDVFIKAEDAAFRQATMISVVSEVVRDSLIARGVNPAKILVNPNGADPVAYAPLTGSARQELRDELGFAADDCVVGFTGTFGGWHGIDVLANAIPAICARAPRLRFLLIGDGTHKHLIDNVVAERDLAYHVRSVGRVPQQDGARMLPACDLFVSPHNSHMVDSKFFGSPTKLFEYMAVGGGIVGSDLEQLGEVLSPALRVEDFLKPGLQVTNERAVLCVPGDVTEFVEAVVSLAERPALAAALGRNARQAVLDSYSWQRHVANVWRFLAGEAAPAAVRVGKAAVSAAPGGDKLDRVRTGDEYKEEVQDQWNNNPVGSHYATENPSRTLDWYKEVERYRYAEYAPWMPEVMEYDRHAGEKVLEIGGGLGTDLSQFARHGSIVTDVDLSAGHLGHARENFALRGLTGEFVHHDAETLPFADNTFDVVYSNGVIHHTPNTERVVGEIRRVLKPGGKAIIMLYAEHSWHYWYRLVWEQGWKRGMLQRYSIGEIMSRRVEITKNDARPLVKVYGARRLRRMFKDFSGHQFFKRQMVTSELPEPMQWLPVGPLGKLVGWNIIIKATKPRG